MYELPKDYDGSLNDYNYDEAEPGEVALIKPKELKVEEIYIEGPISGQSYYSIPAINLVNACDGYEPDFILCYLPNEKKYGTWDCDHWVLYCFENTSWIEIKNNPIKYLNAQWSPEEDSVSIFNPNNYELINGWPI